jgi:thiol:disulfide interchange protein DsbA
MQRREFSLSAATVAAATLGVIALPAQAQGKPPTEGTDYLTLDKPASTEAPAGKIEVVEFFWYSCPHCNHFEPQLQASMSVVRRSRSGPTSSRSSAFITCSRA